MGILTGKRAIVTGSTSGIGLGVARALAAEGAAIVINSFTERDEDHALARDLAAEFGTDARYVAADMSKGGDCRRLIAEAGGCDILVNNAGIQHVAPIEEFPTERWDAIIAINLSSAFHATRLALPAADGIIQRQRHVDVLDHQGFGFVVQVEAAYLDLLDGGGRVGLTADCAQECCGGEKAEGSHQCRIPGRW